MNLCLRIFLALGAFGLAACSGRSSAGVELSQTLRFERSGADSVRERIVGMEYLPLECREGAAFRDADKIVMRNDLIYIGDLRSDRIVVYDMTGKFRFVLDRKGRGPGEYLEIVSFAVDDRYLYTLDNFRRMVDLYDCRSGAWIESRELPITAWDMEVFDTGDFLFAFAPMNGGRLQRGQPDCLLFVTDSDLRIQQQLFPYGDGYCELYGRTPFFTSTEDRIVFSSFYFDGYTLFDRSDPSACRNVGIAFERPIPAPERSDYDAVASNGYAYLGETPFLCGRYVACEIVEDEEGETWLYDSVEERFICNAGRPVEGLLRPRCSCRDRLVALIPDCAAYDAYVGAGLRRADAAAERMIREGSPALLLYALR